MKIFDTLNRKNFELYAAQNYNNPECIDIEEFKEDLARFKYLKRLLRRYEVNDELFSDRNVFPKGCIIKMEKINEQN